MRGGKEKGEGERRRFAIHTGCLRWKRLYHSCLLHQDELDCDVHLLKLHECAMGIMVPAALPASGAPQPTK